MATTTTRVVARIIAQPDKAADVRAILLGLIEPVRREKGCLCYELLQNKADPTDFTFVEEWASEAELDAHSNSAHLANAVSQLGNLVACKPDIRRYAVLA